MNVVRLDPADAQRFRDLRLRSLRDAPDAFGSTYESVVARPLSDWPQMLDEIATFVASKDGRDCGLVRCAPDHTREDSAWLISMWVAPEARRMGVGDGLVEAVVRFAGSAGYERLYLDVADGNEAAIHLYAKHGFEPTGHAKSMAPPRDRISEHRRMRRLGEAGESLETSGA